MENNVFIATGEFVFLASCEVIRSEFVCGECANYLFVFLRGKRKASAKEQSFVPPGTVLRFYPTGSLLRTIVSMFRFKRDLISLTREHGGTLFVGNCCHLATNYAALSSRRFDKRNLVVEGIANYYWSDYSRCGTALLRIAKTVIGAVIGLRYKAYKGHLSGADTGRFEAIYCFNPSKLVSDPGIVRTISPSIAAPRGGYGTVVMVLDQPIEALLTSDAARCVRSKLMHVVENMRVKGAKVYYKSHPASDAGAAGIPASWQRVNAAVPAEVLVSSLEVTHCVSFFSSALMNVKDFFKDVGAISVGLNALANEKTRYTLMQLFIDRAIHLIEA